MAATGMPAQGPSIYMMIANANEKNGNFGEVWQAYEAIKRIGQMVGPKQLAGEDRHVYFAVVKALGEDASKRDDIGAAIENYRLFSEYEPRASTPIACWRICMSVSTMSGRPCTRPSWG